MQRVTVHTCEMIPQQDLDYHELMGKAAPHEAVPLAATDPAYVLYVDEYIYNIQCSEIFTLRYEKLHTEA